MNPMMRYTVIFLAMFAQALLFSPCGAARSNPWTHTFYFENDLFNGTDSNYTNGVKYTLISPDLSPHAPDGKLPRRVLEFIHGLPFIAGSRPEYTHKAEFSLGQKMFTPRDTDTTELVLDDRPYVGWTYFTTAYHRRNDAAGKVSFMDTVELQLGIIGPESYAEDTQKFVHRARDLDIPRGWHHQLENEAGLAIVFERKWLLRPAQENAFGYSTIAHAGAALGNVFTYGNAGMEFRLGWNIPKDFGVSLMRPAGSTRLEIGDRFSAYLFGAVNGKAVGRDIFLDGNTFRDSHDIDKKHFVADLAGGVAFSFQRFIVTWTQLLRTKEFEGQENAHSFGALALSFSFPIGAR